MSRLWQPSCPSASSRSLTWESCKYVEVTVAAVVTLDGLRGAEGMSTSVSRGRAGNRSWYSFSLRLTEARCARPSCPARRPVSRELGRGPHHFSSSDLVTWPWSISRVVVLTRLMLVISRRMGTLHCSISSASTGQVGSCHWGG